MDWTPLIIVLAISAILIPLAFKLSEQAQKNADIRAIDFANFLHNFNLVVTQSLCDSTEMAGIALDEVKKEICLWTYKADFAFFEVSGQYSGRKIKYSDILSIAIVQDDISILETNRTSQLGGALVGGILLGGVGAAVGALSGKKQSSTGKVKKLELVIKLNDTSNPIFTISKLHSETFMNNQNYIVPKKELDYWHAVFEAIIKQADMEYQNLNHASSREALSVSDELKKLAELKESGILTEDEFIQQKQKLLHQ